MAKKKAPAAENPKTKRKDTDQAETSGADAPGLSIKSGLMNMA